MQSQMQFIKSRLRENGQISRNECLRHYISRLGARINDLKKEGWEFTAYWQENEFGRDYIYKLLKAPNRQKPLL